jgi:hypothetical protein
MHGKDKDHYETKEKLFGIIPYYEKMEIIGYKNEKLKTKFHEILNDDNPYLFSGFLIILTIKDTGKNYF